MKIGFFDSGIGGLTVLREAIKELPNADYLYYADTKNVPYGTKSKEEVKRYTFEAAEFIIRQGVTALIIACNTATSIAINDLRKEYKIPVLGMEPAVKPAIEKGGGKRVLVLATPLTLKEEKFQNLVAKLNSEHVIDPLPMPELVGFAEKFIFDKQIILSYLREKFASMDMNQYGTVVLGCTHFAYFKNILKEFFKKDMDIIDGSRGTVKHLKNLLSECNYADERNGTGKIIFYSSGKRETDPIRFIKYMDLLE